MTRHDGSSQVPIIFERQPNVRQILALQDYALDQIWWNAPLVISQALLLAEVLRTYPAEAAMLRRIYVRKKLNLAEMMFFSIKYTSLLSVILTTLVQLTKVPGTDARCMAFSWASNILTFAICTLVVATIAWRTSIIFHRSRRVLALLGAGLLVQVGLTAWAVINYYRTPIALPNGLCAPQQTNHKADPSFFELSTFWYVLYNALFDLAMVVSSSARLWQSARGPLGFARVSSLLFANNVHYAICADVVNLVELVTILGFRGSVPSYQYLVIAIQGMVGMQMLITEQEAVYAPRGATVASYNFPLQSIGGSHHGGGGAYGGGGGGGGSGCATSAGFAHGGGAGSTSLSSAQALRKSKHHADATSMGSLATLNMTTLSEPDEPRMRVSTAFERSVDHPRSGTPAPFSEKSAPPLAPVAGQDLVLSMTTITTTATSYADPDGKTAPSLAFTRLRQRHHASDGGILDDSLDDDDDDDDLKQSPKERGAVVPHGPGAGTGGLGRKGTGAVKELEHTCGNGEPVKDHKGIGIDVDDVKSHASSDDTREMIVDLADPAVSRSSSFSSSSSSASSFTLSGCPPPSKVFAATSSPTTTTTVETSKPLAPQPPTCDGPRGIEGRRAPSPIPYHPPQLLDHPYTQRPRTADRPPASAPASSLASLSHSSKQGRAAAVIVHLDDVDASDDEHARAPHGHRQRERDGETSPGSAFSVDGAHHRSLRHVGGSVQSLKQTVRERLDSIRARAL
ncbi:uncharacterized protein PFL1_04022 [Pseudozyma flocculosa PF-1]|uniref:Uncharacterized protein n=2 Tax=Pseudozyma flocculosa TaxID=84751 RepID=A0A5C3EVY3_9BASI|nr:uncharacterized protein PFL1_04022 [Pseudozyma flocculosa PF-1]EPQ28194.1 hypothetical protein PFL1_04022 [Pseudozyma flocculosa PF-1]SPO35329.1 uncharacterized protein PSFLO_00800 [Pseudozyma flocculosa]